MKTYKRILSTIFALTLTLTMLTSCGETAETPAESKGETTTTATEVSEAEATTTTTTEAIEDSEPEITEETKTTTTTEVIETSEPETTTEATEPEVTTTEVTTPAKDELLSVEECIKWLVSEEVGEEVEITNIDCDEIARIMIVTFDNGMEVGTNNVAAHYIAGDQTSIDQYHISKDTLFDYFITCHG